MPNIKENFIKMISLAQKFPFTNFFTDSYEILLFLVSIKDTHYHLQNFHQDFACTKKVITIRFIHFDKSWLKMMMSEEK